MTTTTIDDTIEAQIIPVDLYSIIHPIKEQQFAQYSRNWDSGYEEKMLALHEGKPQKRLQEDRIAREVVRAILSSNKWAVIEGTDTIISTYGAIKFPEVSDEEIRKRLFGLMNEDGLLDMMCGCHRANRWCFESEIIYGKDIINRSGEEKPIEEHWAKFVGQPQIRDAIKEILKPFEAEKPQYVMS